MDLTRVELVLFTFSILYILLSHMGLSVEIILGQQNKIKILEVGRNGYFLVHQRFTLLVISFLLFDQHHN